MTEISAATGSDYDRIFVQRVREAHGIVLPILAQVRVSTRNSLMRDFATVGTQFVNRHIGYLESTGLVDYNALPAAPDPTRVHLHRRPGRPGPGDADAHPRLLPHRGGRFRRRLPAQAQAEARAHGRPAAPGTDTTQTSWPSPGHDRYRRTAIRRCR